MKATAAPFRPRDVVAGISVALLLVPQAMAYAELAGLPGRHGLFAAVGGPIAAALLVSSPFLQTGPAALTALLTFGALAPLATVGGAEYIGLAALLAVMVGLIRIGLGAIRAGWISYLMSRPMLEGFTSAAAVLIIAGQLPGLFGADPGTEGVMDRALTTLMDPSLWHGTSLAIGILTVAVIRGLRRVNRAFPGAVVVTVVGLAYSVFSGFDGAVVGALDAGMPVPSLELPWRRVPELLIPAVVLALVGFAEVSSIARLYAARERQRWSPDREFFSQGAANAAAGLLGGMPVGGSFARSSLGYISGGRSRWTGFVAGAAVLAFLPFSGILSALPRAVLAGIVVSAVLSLVRFRLLARLWRVSRPQSLVGWTTFGVTLLVAPRIEQGVLFGIVAGMAVHLWRELRPAVETVDESDTSVHLRPQGVLWFGSAAYLERELLEKLSEHREADRIVFHLDGLGRIDVSGALLLEEFVEEAKLLDVEVEFVGLPEHARRVMDELVDVVEPTDPLTD